MTEETNIHVLPTPEAINGADCANAVEEVLQMAEQGGVYDLAAVFRQSDGTWFRIIAGDSLMDRLGAIHRLAHEVQCLMDEQLDE